MTNWPNVIRKLMQDVGMSERELANRLSLHRSVLRCHLAGTGHFPIQHVEAILQELGATLTYVPPSPTPSARGRRSIRVKRKLIPFAGYDPSERNYPKDR